MKKRIKWMVIVWGITLLLGFTSKAEELNADADWTVTFDEKKQMTSNFTNKDIADFLTNMQPGDSANFQVAIQNKYTQSLDWYMTNEVVKSLEDTSKVARGGAYSYCLTYTSSDGSIKIIYDSEKVGGEKSKEQLVGLHEATNTLENYFFLDNLSSGEKGVVKLRIVLEGETQGNDYQDTFAKVKINFAVELPETVTEEKTVFQYVNRKKDNHITKTVIGDKVFALVDIEEPEVPRIVKTGDETNLTFLFAIAFFLGILLLMLAIAGMHLRREIKEVKNE